ncbi:uncharacterized protein LOC130367817 isoform X1 [Hyla sarda]|uniref:uncharacterized protein LOC130367817 isoform X1 n=1 Tax=Hyla sarda TaxID=327740 RepID=UPI0024C3B66E|nr:uncharacterized protein LOC130367817 isoform X1 [Hyla sarda]
MTTDKWVLKIIAEGYSLNFVSIPPERFIVSRANSIVQLLLRDFLNKRALEPVPPEQQGYGVYSHVFPVPKSNGKWRLIIDLRYLNHYLAKEKFRMENVRSATHLIQPHDWMVSLDLMDAYLHVPIEEKSRRFLRVAVFLDQKIHHFQFRALPFGLTSAPRVFTKIAVTVVATLRLQGIQIIPYLDDWLLVATTQELLLQHLQTTLNLLNRLGFILNPQKSELSPTKTKRFLGMIINSVCQKVFLPAEKQDKIILQVKTLIKSPSTSIRRAMQTLGLMTAAIDAVPYARAHMRDLQREILTVWDRVPISLDSTISLSGHTRLKLRWWLQKNNLNMGKSFKPQNPVVITTDASSQGWGAHLGTQWVQGVWSREESHLSSNLRELKAIRLAIMHFSPQISDASVLIQSDNLVSVYYIQKEGGTRSTALQKECSRIMSWAEHHRISLMATHIKGSLNYQADWLSRRKLDPNEWELNPKYFAQITRKWGLPVWDLMATRRNKKVLKFCSRYCTDLPDHLDAFTMSWKDLFVYLFPPIPLINKILNKIIIDEPAALLIAPFWPRRAWFPLLFRLSRGEYWKLPLEKDLLLQNGLYHQHLDRLHLTLWILRGKDSDREDYQMK